MLSGDVSLCSVFDLVSLLWFPPPWHLRFCQRRLRCCFPTEVWEEAACQRWKELTVTRMHIISDTFIHCVLVNTLIFTLAVFQTLLRTHTQKHRRTHTHRLLFHTCTTPHLYTIALTAWGGVDGLDIWSWLTRRENEGELPREEKRRGKKRQNLEERERFSEATCRKEGEKQKETIQAAKRRAMWRGRGRQRSWEEQRGQRGRCVKEKWDMGKASCSQIHSPDRQEFSRISMLLLKDMAAYPPYLPDFNLIWWLASPHVGGNESTARESCSSQEIYATFAGAKWRCWGQQLTSGSSLVESYCWELHSTVFQCLAIRADVHTQYFRSRRKGATALKSVCISMFMDMCLCVCTVRTLKRGGGAACHSEEQGETERIIARATM